MYKRRPKIDSSRTRILTIPASTKEPAMNFTMSPEIEAVRDMVSRFMQNEVVPVMEDYEKRRNFRAS